MGEDVLSLLVIRAFDPLKYETFQRVVGGIMTLLIAMEFNHSILAVTKRQYHFIQVKTVILVAMLALAFISLKAVYWLMRERDAWSSEHGDQEECLTTRSIDMKAE